MPSTPNPNEVVVFRAGRAMLPSGEEIVFIYHKYPYHSRWEVTIINQPKETYERFFSETDQ